MTSYTTISNAAHTDHLPAPCSLYAQDRSTSGLPRPMSSTPNTADSGRIKFGATARLPASR